MGDVNLWPCAAHALEYLSRADAIPHRTEGEAELLRCLPRQISRVLDLGSGDGRLLALIKLDYPDLDGVALDFSPKMLELLHERFGHDRRVEVMAHDMDMHLPASMGTFDAIVSSFAIHHVSDTRKRSLYAEIFDRLNANGVFCNLEHVSSPTAALHQEFLDAISCTPNEDDPSNKLLDVETQLEWMREIGFADADCLWKWRELALLAGRKPH